MCWKVLLKWRCSDYRLDVKKYISLPSYSYDAMLKMTGVEIELITDVSAYLMVE